MELNMSTSCMKTHHGLEDDDAFSNISRISCGIQNSLNSTCNSDSECSGPISVRDMIQHYNNQLKQSESNQINHKNTYKVNTCKKYHHNHASQHLLAATKSSYCGLNNYGTVISCANCKQFADQIEDDNHNHNHNHVAEICCKMCTACTCCRNRSRKNSTTTKLLSSTSSSLMLLQPNENNRKPNNNFNMPNNNTTSGSCTLLRSSSSTNNCKKINAKDTRILAVENCSNTSDGADINADPTIAATNNPNILNDFCAEPRNISSGGGPCQMHNSQIVVEKQKNRLLSTDSALEANMCQQPPAETSYQSKTTIAKTSSGVRIIIDIFFDQERSANGTDIVGSRVETEIPESRILNEFQKQAMAVANDANAAI